MRRLHTLLGSFLKALSIQLQGRQRSLSVTSEAKHFFFYGKPFTLVTPSQAFVVAISFYYLRSGVIDDLLGGQITFVSDEELVDVLAGVPVDLLQPLLHVVEGLLVGHIVDHDDAVRAAVITAMKIGKICIKKS